MADGIHLVLLGFLTSRPNGLHCGTLAYALEAVPRLGLVISTIGRRIAESRLPACEWRPSISRVSRVSGQHPPLTTLNPIRKRKRSLRGTALTVEEPLREIPPWSFKRAASCSLPPGSQASSETGSPALGQLRISDCAAWQQTQERVADAESPGMHGEAFMRRCISPLPTSQLGMRSYHSRDDAALSLPLHERSDSTASSPYRPPSTH